MSNKQIQLKDQQFGTLIVRVDDQGIARGFKADIPLVEGDEVVVIQGRPFITVRGMDKLQRVTGLSILTPSQVMVDGRALPNPYIERDEAGLIRSITVRKLVIGPAPTGQLVAYDYVLSYNRVSILLQSIAKKAARYPQAAFLGTADDDPNLGPIKVQTQVWKNKRPEPQEMEVGGKGRWVFYSLDGITGYWVDLTHPEIQAIFQDYVTILTTLERRAQSICMRNALAHHPAIGGAYAQPGGPTGWHKVVYGIRYEQDPAGLKKVMEQVEKGEVAVGDLDVSEVHQIEAPGQVEDLEIEKEEVPEEELPDKGGDLL